MGTHPNAPSTVTGSNTALKSWLQSHPEALGERVLQRFGTDLPFLFKVLSVQTALSIQSHPDKKLAERLHGERPQVYKDDNHKPEMAIAVSDFEALCSFVSPSELAQTLAGYPELQPCIGASNAEASARTSSPNEQERRLKTVFTALMTADAAKVKTAIDNLERRLREDSAQRALTPKEQIVLRLNIQYPGDVGVLAALFLNLVTLQAGQALYLSANEPHAYISGQIMECMATSDNVIRAGLTPKLRDTGVLCGSLTYAQGFPEVLSGTEVQQYTAVYSPPFDEFEVFRVLLPAGASTLIPPNQGPSVLLIQRGSGLATAQPSLADKALNSCPLLSRGAIFFVPAKTSLALNAGEEGLEAWIAAVNSRVFADRFVLPGQRQSGALQAA